MRAIDRLCLALDVPSAAEAEALVEELKDHVGLFKIGMQLFASAGPQVVRNVQGKGGGVFLDLKFHDIPNTVAHAGEASCHLGVRMFNVHASGGSEMMRAVMQAVMKSAGATGQPKPIGLAVTILTSLSTQDLHEELGMAGTVEEQVVSLAKLALAAGMDGVVASAKEIRLIREACGDKFVILTPGIRPAWAAEAADQKRITTPAQAISDGADFIVVGRPILGAKNRVEACVRILSEISDGLARRPY